MEGTIRYKISMFIILFTLTLFSTCYIIEQNFQIAAPVFNMVLHRLFIDNVFISWNCMCNHKRSCHQFNSSLVNRALLANKNSSYKPYACEPYRYNGSCQKNGSFECVHYINSLTSGRTGNLMFQVAALFSTASRHGYTAIVSPSNPLKQFFTLPNLSFMKLVNTRTFHDTTSRIYDRSINDIDYSSNWTLQGFYQSWRYFKENEHIIRRVFTFKERIASKVKGFISKVNPHHLQSVCLHVRRGDFVYEEAERERGHIAAPVSYISSAVNYFRTKYKHIQLFVLSDDKGWCKENLKFENMTLSPFDSEGYDMALMAFCDHVIVTAGTFGWWGGWLSNGDVVYWTGYPPRESSLARDTRLEDYYPNHWIGL